MDQKARTSAEAVLRRLLVGGRICGVNFCWTPVLVITGDPPGHPESSLHIENGWRFFDSSTRVDPSPDEKQTAVEDLVARSCGLRDQPIVGVRLGDESPHLFVTFTDGRGLFLDGHHDLYECWQLYADGFTVVAMMGDDLAIWAPDDFAPA